MSQRKATLEMDKMEGTEFPPNSVDFEGKKYNLQSIYSEAGLTLEVDSDESTISNLKGPHAAYKDGELDSLMKAHRNPFAQGDKISAWLVVVNGLFYDENPPEGQEPGPSPAILGRMFDPQQRLGTAVFYANDMIRTDPKAFLRTTAHEVGHQFNLHHPDGTSFTQNGITKYTIMNQTRIIRGSSEGWPLAIGFKFGDQESIHLSSHPIKNVKPGGGPFYYCNAEHKDWHNDLILDSGDK
jgi:hypothetical protein